ncbi:hypothetical protein E2320_003168 [Naja naja]|nr:hypothetical protein E2320_003168 [Naja naja]
MESMNACCFATPPAPSVCTATTGKAQQRQDFWVLGQLLSENPYQPVISEIYGIINQQSAGHSGLTEDTNYRTYVSPWYVTLLNSLSYIALKSSSSHAHQPTFALLRAFEVVS